MQVIAVCNLGRKPRVITSAHQKQNAGKGERTLMHFYFGCEGEGKQIKRPIPLSCETTPNYMTFAKIEMGIVRTSHNSQAPHEHRPGNQPYHPRNVRIKSCTRLAQAPCIRMRIRAEEIPGGALWVGLSGRCPGVSYVHLFHHRLQRPILKPHRLESIRLVEVLC